ncbi:hypothetical protein [Paenibacillus sp. ISL-20]|uniref:hypothetical protein n=1 Tax=Paenibacillus sp. ISL-20 TaxID=2819163 RepID=UPI001BE74B3B|nr:hypothetical protein [Paenibacillus sp. ISL-20]MBT2761889.1 hypothetical protein [Paenibacillus sp. ISL-20]
MKKKFGLSAILAISFAVSALLSPGLVKAEEAPKPEVVVDLGTPQYYDSETGVTYSRIYQNTENGFEEISFEEFKASEKKSEEARAEIAAIQRSQDQQSLSNISPLANPIYVENTYIETFHGTNEKVSSDMNCPSASSGCAIEHAFSLTKTESFQAGLDFSIKQLITVGASFNWQTSATTSTTYIINIPKGAKGSVWFRPYYRYTGGTYHPSFGSPYSVYGMSPKKLSSGQLDGLIFGIIN